MREGDGVGAKVLESLGSDLPSVREQVMLLLQGYKGFTVEQHAQPSVTDPTALMRPRRTITFNSVGKEWTRGRCELVEHRSTTRRRTKT